MGSLSDLPSHHELVAAPERAHLAMLRVAATLAARTLVLEHGDIGDDFPPASVTPQPTTLIAILLLGRLDELAHLPDWYEDAVGKLVASQRPSPGDLPF